MKKVVFTYPAVHGDGRRSDPTDTVLYGLAGFVRLDDDSSLGCRRCPVRGQELRKSRFVFG